MPARGRFVQKGGVGTTFLDLHSFCSWFLSNPRLHFVVVYVEVRRGGKKETVRDMYMDTISHEATECHLTNCKRSTLDPTTFNHWQLQNVLRKYVGRNFGWHRPNYKMSLGKFMLVIPIFSYLLTSDALDFVVLILNYFPSQKRLCSVFCSCKKGTMHWIL